LPSSPPHRWAWADVDLDVVAQNAARLAELARPAALWAVVKANAYGHGDREVARAAVTGGAQGLCVATVDEALRVRGELPDAPLLLLSEPPRESLAELVGAGIAITVFHPEWVTACGDAARVVGRTCDVHVKIDTGMHRIGASPDALAGLLSLVHDTPGVRLAGVMTHFAAADEPNGALTARQTEAFRAALATTRDAGASGVIPPGTVVHVANSAATLDAATWRAALAEFDLPLAVRSGIALYGVAPSAHTDLAAAGIRAPLTLRARVTNVQRLTAGEGVSYGHRTVLDRDTVVATVPLGYADGIRRDAGMRGGVVLIGGRRRRILGVVTMDQLMVDCGTDDVSLGDEVVIIGTQGGESIRAEDWATTLDTIGYEVLCAISPRVPRNYVGSGR
jgi:alanine racemase